MRRYAKPIVVVESLSGLHGPISGSVSLPRHLDWTGPALYNLDEPARTVDFYRTVLVEATKPADLYAYLDRATLIELWPALWLPAALRNAWEQQFSELRPNGPGRHAA